MIKQKSRPVIERFLKKITKRNHSGVRGLIDVEYYYQNYTDVAEAGEQAERHYMRFGWKEGRNPSSTFNTLYYWQVNMVDAELSENPLLHFKRHGRKNINISTMPDDPDKWLTLQKNYIEKYFDPVYYLSQLRNDPTIADPIDHFMRFGAYNGINPHQHFNMVEYSAANLHIAKSSANPFYHALVTNPALRDSLQGSFLIEDRKDTCDLNEGVDSSETETQKQADGTQNEDEPLELKNFDADYYLRVNKDVAAHGADPFHHYMNYGWKEGRNPSQIFNTNFYRHAYKEFLKVDENPLTHYVYIGAEVGFRPNAIGTQKWIKPTAPPDDAWLSTKSALRKDVDVVVVVPVYRGFDDTLATIYSVLNNGQASKFSLMVINDASPDVNLTIKLRKLAEQDLFIYIENEVNLGFIGSVNKALRSCPHNDVILLNSDTIVYSDWIDRMLAHSAADPRIATITPFSNNATLCSYPDNMEKNVLALECSCENLDRFAADCNKGRRLTIPTGVGFCLYIRRSVLIEIGLLDPIFGRGYGEENDFCLRAIKSGYTNILAEDVFVYHSGEVSFAEFVDQEFLPGQNALVGKHPDYKRRMTAFLSADYGKDGRARLDLYRFAKDIGCNSALFFCFDGTGGVTTHIDSLSKRLEETGVKVVLAYVKNGFITIKPFNHEANVYRPSGPGIAVDIDDELLQEFLVWLNPKIVHVHSFAHASWAATCNIMSAVENFSGHFFITLHDFNPVCHRNNMIRADGSSCRDIDDEICTKCIKHDQSQLNRTAYDDRIARWRSFLGCAKAVFAPSINTRDTYIKWFPELKISVRPHEEAISNYELQRALLEEGLPLRIITVGAIGPHKGSDILYSMAEDIRNRRLPIEIHIVGYSAIPSDMATVGVAESGAYISDDECLRHVEKIKPHLAIFPSIWAETYCYALSICLAVGIPCIAFDLGAQAERIRHSGFGAILPAELMDNPAGINDFIMKLSLRHEWAQVKGVPFSRYEDILVDYYGV